MLDVIGVKISIIIPAYNISSYLGSCLDSVCAQTHQNIEIIVVNDGSIDDTAQVIDEYVKRDNRIKAIHMENGGVTSARMKGMQVATGEYVGFVDGDDYIEPDMYQLLLENAIKYHADISHCGYQMVFPSGRTDYYYNTGRIVVRDQNQGVEDLLKGEYIEPGLWNKLYHRSVVDSFLDSNTMDMSIKINEDLLMNYYLFKESRFSVFEDVCPYHYLVRGNSAANTKINKYQLLDPLKVTRSIYLSVQDNAELKGIVSQKYVRQLVVLATMDESDNPELIVPISKSAIKELHKNSLLIIRDNKIGFKLRVMALVGGYMPRLYGYVHKCYSRVTGIDKKYSLE